MKKIAWLVMASLWVVLGSLSTTLAGQAGYDEKAVADFYRGKTLNIVVGHSAGGGFDRYGRMIGRHIGKYIPGNPVVVVSNMVGAGTMVSANYTYNQAPKDGTVINSFDGGLFPSQLYGSKAIKFDFTKFNYIGAPDVFKYITVVTKQSGITKMEDFLTGGKELVVGAVPNTSIQHAAMLLKEVLGAKVKIVSGFKGTNEIRLAMKADEVNSVITGWESLGVSNMNDFRSGEWLILSQWLEEPIGDLPVKNVPLISEFLKTEEQKQLFNYGVIKPNISSRPYAMPPGVPMDRVNAVRDAFQRTLRDREFLAEAAKSKMSVAPIKGEDLLRMFNDGLAMPAAIKEKLRPILAPKG